jgi:YHS domain-containing protein
MQNHGEKVFLIRTIILIVFIYLCFRVVKDLVLKPWLSRQSFSYRPRTDERTLFTGEMVQDPVCQVYLTRQDAHIVTVAGQTYYFCSEACMKKFTEQKR